MSKANVSFAAFFEVAGLETELLPREYVAVCEAVGEFGHINAYMLSRVTAVPGVCGS